MRREDSPTLRKWRESTPRTPDGGPGATYWPDSDHVDKTDLTTTRGEDHADRFAKDAEALRYPDSRPNPNPAPSGWPRPLGDAAYHGLAGDIVRAVSPYSEASDEAILVDLLVSFGVMVGKGPYYYLGASAQQPRLFAVIVGDTARGRKGAARGVVKLLTADADLVYQIDKEGIRNGTMSWTRRHYLKGLTSGEGLVKAVEDTGTDGRVLIVEEELARLITSAARDGSTLSALIRDAYDNNDLAVRNKNSSLSVSGAYVAALGNITQAELLTVLGGKNATETLNGFGNRFLYIASRRTRLIPKTKIPERILDQTTRELKDVVKRARKVEEMTFTAPAERIWREWYYGQGEPEGLFGVMTARLDVHTTRAAMVYALLEGSSKMTTAHLEAALEMTRYAEDSARYILGDATGSTIADRILRELRLPVITDPLSDSEEQRGELTRKELFALFDGNITKDELDDAVLTLVKAGLVEEAEVATGGRPRKVVRLR